MRLRWKAVTHKDAGLHARPERAPLTRTDLFSCPERVGLPHSWRLELHSAPPVRQTPVHQLHVLLPGEEAPSDGHAGTGYHVVLNKPGKRLPILL